MKEKKNIDTTLGEETKNLPPGYFTVVYMDSISKTLLFLILKVESNLQMGHTRALALVATLPTCAGIGAQLKTAARRRCAGVQCQLASFLALKHSVSTLHSLQWGPMLVPIILLRQCPALACIIRSFGALCSRASYCCANVQRRCIRRCISGHCTAPAHIIPPTPTRQSRRTARRTFSRRHRHTTSYVAQVPVCTLASGSVLTICCTGAPIAGAHFSLRDKESSSISFA